MAVAAPRTYLQRALHRETWTRLAKGSVDVRLIATALGQRGLKRLRGRVSEVASRIFGPSFEMDEVPRSFLQMLERGVQVLVVYGDTDGGLDELALHLGRGMRRLRNRPNAELAFITHSDHTLTTSAARKTLLEFFARVVLPRR